MSCISHVTKLLRTSSRRMHTLRKSIPVYANTRTALQHTFDSFNSPKDIYDNDRPLFVNDTGVIERQCDRWASNLPRVRPFYAVKCNPDEAILKQLVSSGSGFDCATRAEIEAVLKLGVDPADIIFANPVKPFADIKFAQQRGVKKMTFDNEQELQKIKNLFPEAELVLRLLPDDSGSLMRFGVKFGASLDQVRTLLALSVELKMNVIGVSFHIGSGCFDPLKYDSAIGLSRTVFDLARAMELPPFQLLDIGGGFPGNPTRHEVGRDGVPSFESFATVIEQSIEKFFPKTLFPNLQCISEPGRYFATAASTLFTLIQGKRKEAHGKYLYYINDGVYGSFNSIMFDHAKPLPCTLDQFFAPPMSSATSYRNQTPPVSASASPIPKKNRGTISMSSAFSAVDSTNELNSSTIFGPTCDSIDLVVEEHPMRELHVGDWLVFDHMGAYTTAAASAFNGVQPPVMAYVRSLKD